MKNLLSTISLATFCFLFLGSFSVQTATAQSSNIKSANIVWKGYKVTGSHEGTVNLKDGMLMIDNDELKGGSFTIDMSSITCTDLEGEYKGKLEGHLKSDDFFGVEKHGTASLYITKAEKTGKNSYNVTGDLTIKGITKTIEFPVSIYGNKANANIKIDRSKFDVRYGSGTFFDGLQDNLIYDEFDLVIDMEFNS
jgi:polyisoprenoid-binding protein YceI